MIYFLHLFHRNYVSDTVNSVQKITYAHLQQLSLHSATHVMEYSLQKIVRTLKQYHGHPTIVTNILGEGMGEGLFWMVTVGMMPGCCFIR